MAEDFTRAELYDLVWSRPRTSLAKELGVSDVAIGKYCVAAHVPTPSMGYWARLKSGGKAVRLPLPIRLPGQADVIVFGREANRYWRRGENLMDEPIPPSFAESLEDQVASAVKRIGRVAATRDLTAPDKSLTRVLQKEAKRRAKYSTDRWDWHKPHFDEPVFQRQLRLFNSLTRALSPLYGPQVVLEEDEWIQGRGTLHHLVLRLDFGGVAMNLRVHEPGEPRRDRAPKPVAVTTLRVESGHTDAPLLEWSDAADHKLEAQLPAIVMALLRRAEERLRAHAQWIYKQRCERRDEELAAIEQRKAEAEQRRLEAIEVRKVKIRDEVVELARRHRTAQEIRATIAWLRAHPDVATPEGGAKFEDWAANASAVADGIDPMSSHLDDILGSFEWTPPAVA